MKQEMELWYLCEKCGRRHRESWLAEKCEARHVRVREFEASHNSLFNVGDLVQCPEYKAFGVVTAVRVSFEDMDTLNGPFYEYDLSCLRCFSEMSLVKVLDAKDVLALRAELEELVRLRTGMSPDAFYDCLPKG